MKPAETITHKTTTRLNLRRRLLILFGGNLVVESSIHVDKEVTVLGSSATDRIEFPNKRKQ